jgi:predicted N-acyltransferase
LFAPDLPPEQRRQAVRALLDTVRDQVTAEAEALAFAFFLTWQGYLALAADDRVPAPILSYAGETRLDVLGDRFDDFTGALRRRQRRQVKAEMARFREAGLRIEQEDPREQIGLVARLVDQNFQKYGRASELDFQEAILQRQFAVMGEHARLFVCRYGEAAVGVLLGYVWDGWFCSRMGGFDYARLPGAFEYFNLTIYHPVRYCYEAGLRGIYLGAGSQIAKGRRGAVIEPLVSVVLPFDDTKADDYVPADHRRQVRQYWEGEMREIPRAFDTELWSAVTEATR